MSQAEAEEIAAWRYPGEYSFYDVDADADDLAELLDPAMRHDRYFAAAAGGGLIGFFEYKPPHAPELEVGLGLRPDLTGRGLGEAFLLAGLDFARRRYAPSTFRLSVATFNRRAITVYVRAGFAPVRTFAHVTNGAEWEFLEMTRPA